MRSDGEDGMIHVGCVVKMFLCVKVWLHVVCINESKPISISALHAYQTTIIIVV